MPRQIVSLNRMWVFALDPYEVADQHQRWKSPSPLPEVMADGVFSAHWAHLHRHLKYAAT